MRPSAGSSKLEVVGATLVAVAACVGIHSQARLPDSEPCPDPMELLAGGHARRVLADLASLTHQELLEMTSERPAPDGLRGRFPEARELDFDLLPPSYPLPSAGPRSAEVEGFVGRTANLQTSAYSEELEPGLARVVVRVAWLEAGSNAERSELAVGLVVDPRVGGRDR